ncbi:hypothetical protein HH297_06980 [Xanthomonas sp. Kuri4-3]
MVEELDALAQRRPALHRRAQRRAGAVGAHQAAEVQVVRLVVAVVDEARMPGVEVDRVQPAIEVDARAGGLGQGGGGVAGAGVDHHDLVAEGQRGQAVGYAVGFVERDNAGGNARPFVRGGR